MLPVLPFPRTITDEQWMITNDLTTNSWKHDWCLNEHQKKLPMVLRKKKKKKRMTKERVMGVHRPSSDRYSVQVPSVGDEEPYDYPWFDPGYLSIRQNA